MYYYIILQLVSPSTAQTNITINASFIFKITIIILMGKPNRRRHPPSTYSGAHCVNSITKFASFMEKLVCPTNTASIGGTTSILHVNSTLFILIESLSRDAKEKT